MLQFKVDGQKLTRTDSFSPATDSEQYLKASFSFVSSDWSGVAKKALFRLGDLVYEKVLANNACITPSEVLIGAQTRYAKITGSTMFVSLVGEYGTIRITTNEIAVKLSASGYADAETPAEPAESVYDQLMTNYADAMEATEANAAEIEAARKNSVNGYVHSTLAQRLSAQFNGCVLQTDLEAALGNTVIAYRAEDTANKSLLANALRCRQWGSVIFADDVSPVEHVPAVKIRSANLIPYPYYNSSGTGSGITYTVNTDGSVTVNGTATANAAFYLTYGLSGIKGTVFLSGCPSGGSTSGTGYSLRLNKVVNGEEVTGGADMGNGCKINLNGEAIRVYIVLLKGTTVVNKTFYPMLNIGDSAADFELHSDPTTITVTRCGRNLLDMANSSKASCTISGYGVKANIIDAYYMELYANYLKSAVQSKDGKALTFSVGNVAADSYIALVIMYTDGTYAQKSSAGNSVTLWLDHQGRTVQHVLLRPMAKSDKFTDSSTIITKLMLEFSDSASVFEPYSGKSYTPNENGVVEDLTSLSPMTIFTNTNGATVDCDYVQDTNAVINKLIAAIVALGGVV